jgi:hypothetical protein
LVDKSIEAFIMGLEVYNKPTIRYRIEGFAFFICNAWELMLKAKLLKDGIPINYSDNPERTLDLSRVISKIYTDKHQPLRINLEKIIELRNTSTHFVTEEYESVFAPFFQACVVNFSEQIKRFHDIDITEHIAQNFLTLSVNMHELTNDEINSKYTPEMAAKLIRTRDDAEYLKATYTSNALFIPIRTTMYITKNQKNADLTVNVSKDSELPIRTVKEIKNPNETHKLSFKNTVDAVRKQLAARSIPFNFCSNKGSTDFNNYCLTLVLNFYNLKQDERFAFPIYLAKDSERPNYKYSQQLVEFIVDEIAKDADLIAKIKSASTKQITPGA